MATVRTDPTPPDESLAPRMAALDTELAWLVDRQAQPRELTGDEYDRIQALRNECFDLGEPVRWYKTALGCFGPISDEFEASRSSIMWARAAEARRHGRSH